MWDTWPLTWIVLENTRHVHHRPMCHFRDIFCSCSTELFLLSCLGTSYSCSGYPDSRVVQRIPERWRFSGMAMPKRVLQKKSTEKGVGPGEYGSPPVIITTPVVKICSYSVMVPSGWQGWPQRNNSRISLRSKHTSGLVIFLYKYIFL